MPILYIILHVFDIFTTIYAILSIQLHIEWSHNSSKRWKVIHYSPCFVICANFVNFVRSTFRVMYFKKSNWPQLRIIGDDTCHWWFKHWCQKTVLSLKVELIEFFGKNRQFCTKYWTFLAFHTLLCSHTKIMPRIVFP